MNELSARYSLMPLLFYTPQQDQFALQSRSSNQGREEGAPPEVYREAVERWERMRAEAGDAYGWMLEHLTPAFVKRYFDDVCEGEVERFELPNLLAVNFLLHRSLGGGGTLSLLLDAQGKTYAQFLLAATVEVPEGLLHAETRDADQQEQPHV